jgi:hypothetical protein
METLRRVLLGPPLYSKEEEALENHVCNIRMYRAAQVLRLAKQVRAAEVKTNLADDKKLVGYREKEQK